MKKAPIIMIILLFISAVCGCVPADETPQIAATTLPVYEFSNALCEGTGLTVGRLVTENVSCLHDYTLQVSQMRMIEYAQVIVISGAGLENFLDDVLHGSAQLIDASVGTHIHENRHSHEKEHLNDHVHDHEHDPHIWLSPENAKIMATNIYYGLSALYPEYAETFSANLTALTKRLDDLQHYGESTLAQLSCREMITFHDGFAYLAESFDLTILQAIEEESGSEASAAELKELINLVRTHALPAVFIEQNGSTSAAEIISAETGAQIFVLDMSMAGNSYFDIMYYNINTIKEAFG